MKLTLDSSIGQLLSHPEGPDLVAEYFGTDGDGGGPGPASMRVIPLHMIVRMSAAMGREPARREEFIARLATLDEIADPVRNPIEPAADYEPDAAPASATWNVVTPAPAVWQPVEVAFAGPSHGNPFVDVELRAEVAGPDGAFAVTGFYDGEGTYRLRFLPSSPGTWSFATSSNARSLDGIAGEVAVGEAAADSHGPVRVNGFGFRHADGTRHLSLGTTCYAWTHQGDALEEQTLATLAEAPFTKMRMCVFPKHYLFNANEPPVHGFERGEDGAFDTTRPIPEFFARLERRVADLDVLGIQADIILFHPYDRWGYADLGLDGDDRYLRYVVARLSSFPNVWWSLANEYDLLGNKSAADWDRFAEVIAANDPVGHLLGNHNCITFYDHSLPYITHASLQRTDLYRTAENTTQWREQWGKPVVIDECAYEGDIDMGWGNITGEEMTRRFWEASIRGGWCGHGETYWADDEVLWWSKGGVLKGTSPARIGFLRAVLEDAPGDLEPVDAAWDAPTAVVGERYMLVYFSFMQPRYRTLSLPPGTTWRAEVLDTWNMTITPVDGDVSDGSRIDLPAKQYIAIRLRRTA